VHHPFRRSHADRGRGRGREDDHGKLNPTRDTPTKKTLSPLAADTALSTAFATGAVAEDRTAEGSWSSLPLHGGHWIPFFIETLLAVSDFCLARATLSSISPGPGDIYPPLGKRFGSVGDGR
jgi:hypothetical protein